MCKWIPLLPWGQTLELFISSFTICITSFTIYMLVGNSSITLGANFYILKDANFIREDKYCQRGDKTVKEEIKKFPSLTPSTKYNI